VSQETGVQDPRRIVVGTAGHIDHGKTRLVFALTGTDTDRLPEEKQRGITIDLGFAAMHLTDAPGKPLNLSIVDVPGHQAFIRNMLAGTGGIDCVMLVIAADDGVKAQTTEHLAICTLLGIEHGVVALTKSDAVSLERLEQVQEEVRIFLAGTFLHRAPIVSVSALNGTGLDALKQALAGVAAAVPERSRESVLRLPLDRAFSVRGFGTVVTGTLHAGTVRVGDMLEQHPSGRVLRVRRIQVHGSDSHSASAPCRVALNLAGVEVAQIGRGDTLTSPGTLAPVRTVDVELSMLGDVAPLKHGSRVRVHAFTSDSLARILLFDKKDTAEQRSGLARLQLAKAMLLVPGDRLVLRQCSPAMTIGGGQVLDAQARPGVRKSAVLDFLNRLRSASSVERLHIRVTRRGAKAMSLSALVTETGLTPEALRRIAVPLLQSGAIHECHASDGSGTHWIASEALQAAAAAVESELAKDKALSRAELRSKTQLDAPIFDMVLQRIVETGKYELHGELLRAAGSDDVIPERQRRELSAVEHAYAKAGLAAPLSTELAKELGIAPSTMHQLITLLLRSNRLVRMGADNAFMHADALKDLYSKLRARRGESFDVGSFKAFTGLTRKHAIPLLEHLDQVRVTRNNGGTRVVL
jgi:selenocysteine-specific elongation factor